MTGVAHIESLDRKIFLMFLIIIGTNQKLICEELYLLMSDL